MHTYTVTIKFTFTAVILIAVFSLWQGLSPLNALVTAAVLTVIAYVIGDLWALPTFGNFTATVLDTALAGVTVWAVQLILVGFAVSLKAVLAAALLSGAAEWFYHWHLQNLQDAGPFRNS